VTRALARVEDRTVVAAALLLIVVSHAVIATVYNPADSDVEVYRRYAAAVARGIDDGTSIAVADDNNLRDSAHRNAAPEPAPDSFLIEYPPVAVIWMAAVGIGTDLDRLGGAGREYDGQFRVAMFLVELLLLLVLVRWAAPSLVVSSFGKGLSAERIAVYGLASLILGNLLFDRLDLVVGALLLVGVVSLVRGSWVVSFLILAVAINYKASPIALAPLWVLASLPAYVVAGLRPHPAAFLTATAGRILVLAGLAGIVFLPFLIIEGSRAFDFLRLRALQGVQIESVPGAVLLALHHIGLPLRVTFQYGTVEVQTPWSAGLAAASPVALAIAAIAIAVLYVRAVVQLPGRNATIAAVEPSVSAMRHASMAAIDPPLFLTATVATLLLTLATSKLLSPQYLFWVLPLVPLLDIGRSRTRTFQVSFVVMCLITTAIFPYLFGRTLARVDPAGGGYLDPTFLGVGLVVVRDTLLIWLSGLAVWPLLRRASIAGPRPASQATPFR
jgi:hypothetical protein